MNDHDAMQQLLARRSELGEAEDARLRSHLRGCSDCRERAEEYASQDLILGTLAEGRPPVGLRAAVLSRVDARPQRRYLAGRRLLSSRLVAPLSLACMALLLVLGWVALRANVQQPVIHSALVRGGYTLNDAGGAAGVQRQTAERIALALFPGRVRAATLATVRSHRSPAFGTRGRLCWMVQIVPPSGAVVAQPGSTWLDTTASSSSRAAHVQALIVFVDARYGTFVLASPQTAT